MLRNVCDACEEVIGGEPVMRDYPEALLVIDDEVAVMYENLCPTCKSKLLAAVACFSSRKAAPRPAAPVHEPAAAEPPREEPPQEPAPQDVPREDARPLAEQVVKQYPVKLPNHG